VEEPAYIPKAEFAKLLIAIDDRRFRNLIVFAVLTGMRRGELVSLRWTDIDLTNRLIHIRNKDDFTAKGMRPRTVPMNQDLFGLFQKMNPESEHVFVDASGKPYQGAWVTKYFKRAVIRCGLPNKIHLHSLRHTYASWLVQSSTPLAEVQKLLGHSSVVTTQIYSHLEEEHLRGAAERIRLDQFAPKGLLD
jgi:integrase